MAVGGGLANHEAACGGWAWGWDQYDTAATAGDEERERKQEEMPKEGKEAAAKQGTLDITEKIYEA
jgi:hypothetical protein